MKIDPTRTYAGVPALAVRDLLRRIGGTVTLDFIENALGGGSGRSTALVEALTTAGFLSALGDGRYEITALGLAFGSAKVGTVTRATADRALTGLMTRVRELNADPDVRFDCVEVIVFGSYLRPELDRLGDLDVALELRLRTGLEPDYEDLQFDLPETLRRLKARSRTLSIVIGHWDWLADKPHEHRYTFDPLTRAEVRHPASPGVSAAS